MCIIYVYIYTHVCVFYVYRYNQIYTFSYILYMYMMFTHSHLDVLSSNHCIFIVIPLDIKRSGCGSLDAWIWRRRTTENTTCKVPELRYHSWWLLNMFFRITSSTMCNRLPSGNLLQFANLNMATESLWIFPVKAVDLSSSLCKRLPEGTSVPRAMGSIATRQAKLQAAWISLKQPSGSVGTGSCLFCIARQIFLVSDKDIYKGDCQKVHFRSSHYVWKCLHNRPHHYHHCC